MHSLDGKIAIVTGSASGIGAATAIRLAARGARVLVNYSKSAAEAEEVVATIRAAGGTAEAVQASVAHDADCRKLVEAAVTRWGGVDILVNNAGTTKFAAHQDLDALSAEDFAQIYAVNTIGPFQMVRAARSALSAHGSGAVVNVSSIAGVLGIGSSIAYAASKGALNTMTLSLARALAPAIRVNAVCPGFVATGWFEKRFGSEQYEELVRRQAESSPLKRAGRPEDIADTVVFLASPESANITGECLINDSGVHLTLASGRS